jgi:hypothetical protein
MASLFLTPSRCRRDEREWLCQSLGRRRLRPFRSRRHTSWQIWGLVRSPVPISERHDEGNASLPGCVLYFLCLSQLLVHVAIIRFTLIRMGSPLRRICATAPSRLLG